MSPMSPTMRYQQALAEGHYQPDDVQKRAVERLDEIYQQLIASSSSNEQKEKPSGLKMRLERLLGKKHAAVTEPVQGLYMWGELVEVKLGLWICFMKVYRETGNFVCIFIGL